MTKSRRTVLVVDDLPEIAEFFQQLTRRVAAFNVQVETETDPRRAVERIQAAPYDLVISDFRMRELDGVDVLKAAYEANPVGHRLLMTGYNEIPTPVARIREARVDAYLQKPLRSQDLILLILDFVNHNEAAIDACHQRARELEDMGLREEMAA